MDFSRVLARRSMCRDFDPRPVDRSVLDPVLDAARHAPSAGNTQALDLVVLEGADTHRYWDVTLPEERREGFRWPGLLCAPVLIVPCVTPGAYLERYLAPDKAHSGLGDGLDRWAVPYWWVDGGAAVMALLLAAEESGLGALLFGQFDHAAGVAASLGIPDDVRALGTIALGWPRARRREASALRPRRTLDEVVHRGGW